jgi:hypothetical protein
MEEACSSATMVYNYYTTGHNKPENLNVNSHSHENLDPIRKY